MGALQRRLTAAACDRTHGRAEFSQLVVIVCLSSVMRLAFVLRCSALGAVCNLHTLSVQRPLVDADWAARLCVFPIGPLMTSEVSNPRTSCSIAATRFWWGRGDVTVEKFLPSRLHVRTTFDAVLQSHWHRNTRASTSMWPTAIQDDRAGWVRSAHAQPAQDMT